MKTKKPSKTAPSRRERAYAAGLFDGEGCVFVADTGGLSAKIEMGDLPPVERINYAFGGILLMNRTRPSRLKNKAMHRLRFQGEEALWFLRLILPFMHNYKHIHKIEWLLANYPKYAKVRHDYDSRPRFCMRTDMFDYLKTNYNKNKGDTLDL